MDPIEQVYPNLDAFGATDYDPLIASMGYRELARVEDDDYQGQTQILLREGESGRYGILRFDWGSCSGCDALQACDDNYEEIGKLRQEFVDGITWYDTRAQLLTDLRKLVLNMFADQSTNDPNVFEFLKVCEEVLNDDRLGEV